MNTNNIKSSKSFRQFSKDFKEYIKQENIITHTYHGRGRLYIDIWCVFPTNVYKCTPYRLQKELFL